MTLIFCDGFDLYNVFNNNKNWSVFGNPGGTGFHGFTTGRFGTGSALQVAKGNANGSVYGSQNNLGVNRSTLILGVAWQYNFNSERVIGVVDAGTEQLSIRVDATGHLIISRNGTVLATESAVILVAGSWYFMELKVTIGATGSYALRRNGVVVPGIPDATGVNTQASANSTANQLVLCGVNTGINPGSNFYDDLYVFDNAGTTNNDFLGDTRVVGLLPSGVGTPATTFTKVGAAASNWQSVNDNPNDGDTTYVSSASLGVSETYAFTDLPTSATTVYAVIGEPISRRDDAGARSISTRVFSGGVQADSPTSTALGIAYSIPEHIMETNPVTGLAWTVADVNTGEFGPKVAA